MSLALLIHLTTAMIARTRRGHRVSCRRPRLEAAAPVRPGCLPIRCGRLRSRRRTATMSARFHLAVWMIPIVVLAVNAFWWLPGIWLASTKGESGFHVQPSRRGARAD